MRLGSFVRGTHSPADMHGCLVDHPLITAAADEFAEVAQDMGIAAHKTAGRLRVSLGDKVKRETSGVDQIGVAR